MIFEPDPLRMTVLLIEGQETTVRLVGGNPSPGSVPAWVAKPVGIVDLRPALDGKTVRVIAGKPGRATLAVSFNTDTPTGQQFVRETATLVVVGVGESLPVCMVADQPIAAVADGPIEQAPAPVVDVAGEVETPVADVAPGGGGAP